MRMLIRMGAAFGALFAMMAMVVAVIAFVAFVVVSLAALLGITGYVKRETWTKPAYRWARDKSGRWSRTPWGPGDGSADMQADQVVS